MQGKSQTHVVYHYNNLLLFVEFCAPQIPDAAADSTGGMWNVAFPFLSPFSL